MDTQTLQKRGYNPFAHKEALKQDPTAMSDAVVLTHPINWMDENEAESETVWAWYDQHLGE